MTGGGATTRWIEVELADPRLADYRELRDRDSSRERGVFIAEGLEVVGHLVRAGPRWACRSVFVAKPRLPRLAPALEELDPAVPVFVAEPDAMSEVVGFPIHRGVLAAGARRPDPGIDAVLDEQGDGPARVLALVGLANHDNVGGCFRNAAGLGASAVVMDARSADPLYRKALRVSMGHVLRVPFARSGDGAALMSALHRAGFETVALTPAAGARDLGSFAAAPLPPRLAIVVGAEGSGLPAPLLQAARHRVAIPMAGGTDSLNVATAAGIALWALRLG